MYYAQIESGVVCAVTETHSAIDAPNMILLESFDVSLIGHIYADGVFTAPGVAPVRELTKAEYLKRFTQAERIAIRSAGAANPLVNDYIELMNAVTDVVHLDDLDTNAGVHALESAGLLATGRAAEILA